MELDNVDTLNDLKLWLSENMPGSDVYEDMYGTLTIRTNLTSTMGGYLSPIEREGECDKCASSYELSDKDNRCGDCGNCEHCCTHEREGQ